jgi:L-fuconolactonase
MDTNSVDKAIVICAELGAGTANNDYVAAQTEKHPGRLIQFADVDSSWSPLYHSPGSADRLESAVAKWPMRGITHYLKDEDDGSWLHSDEGCAFLRVPTDKRLALSLRCLPHQHRAIRKAAGMFPDLPIICHHLGQVKAAEEPPYRDLKEVLLSAKLCNIYIKISGFPYGSERDWDFPYADLHRVIRAQYEHYGPDRLCWGSDYPMVLGYMTYRQSIEVLRTHCSFIPDEHRELILGENMNGLLTDLRK